MSELLLIEQRRGVDDASAWIREGRRVRRGLDDDRRLQRLRSGLVGHPRVRSAAAGVQDRDVDRILGALHDPDYLDALWRVRSDQPVVLPALAPPGLAPDIPVRAGLVAAAREAVRTAIGAARRTLAGVRFTYALCRPPGHHAGPRWMAGYCYLNTAAAAARTLGEGGAGAVGILDLDLHYPNGTAAIAAAMPQVSIHSLHAWPVANVAGRTALPHTERERVVQFARAPDAAAYLSAVRDSLQTLAGSAALVLSLGYDTVAGDPHGGWAFAPAMFARLGRLLAASGLQVCIVQEGGYSLRELARCSHALASGLLAGDAA
jgi:acetoin utilization deacetylase AcuC-like enzyme